MKSWTCRCGTRNVQEECETCGAGKPHRKAGAIAPPPRRCAYDGTQLDAHGWCLAGNGYPDYMRCSFACSHCRERLQWSGACYHCTPIVHAYPGTRYDTHDDDGRPIGDGQHWVKTAEAGGPTINDAEAHAAIAKIQVLLVQSSLSQRLAL